MQCTEGFVNKAQYKAQTTGIQVLEAIHGTHCGVQEGYVETYSVGETSRGFAHHAPEDAVEKSKLDRCTILWSYSCQFPQRPDEHDVFRRGPHL